MSLKSILHDIGSWFSKAFNTVKDDVAPLAVTITESIKMVLDTGLVKAITDLIPGTLDDKIVAFLQDAIPKALAIELGLEGLPDNATEEQITAWITSVEKAIGGKEWQAKSQFWTSLSVRIFNDIQNGYNQDPEAKSLSFATIVSIVEDAYQSYKDAKANGEDTNA